MSDIIPTGAYVIRNRETSAVLEITYNQGKLASVSPTDQDEENKREQQIWWVEADPCYDELNAREEKTAKEGGIYRLSNIAHYQSLDLLRGSCSNGTPVVGNKSHGAPWQLWRLRRRKEYTDG
jgi:hypothetical protein